MYVPCVKVSQFLLFQLSIYTNIYPSRPAKGFWYGTTSLYIPPLPALNTPDVKDTDIQYVRDMLVDSLFAMLATAGGCVVCI